MAEESRFRRGWRITGEAWRVIRSDRATLTLAIAQGVFGAVVTVVVFWLSGWVNHPGDRTRIFLAGLISYWPVMLVGTFLGVALAAAASSALDGRHLTVREALAVPARRPGQILLWSLLASVVGILIQELAQRLPLGGRIVAWLGGVAWSLVSIFAIPILALEGCSAIQCVKSSSRILKRRWGETLSGTITISAWLIVILLPLAVAVGVVDGVTHRTGITWLVYLGVVVLLGSLNGAAIRVFSVALYRYAKTDEPQPPFQPADLEHPFTPKRGLFGRRK